MLWSVQPLVRRDPRCWLRADVAQALDRTAEASALSDDVARHSDLDRRLGPAPAVRGSLSRDGARRCCGGFQTSRAAPASPSTRWTDRSPRAVSASSFEQTRRTSSETERPCACTALAG